MKHLLTFVALIALIGTATPAQASTIESAVKNLDSSLTQLITAKDEVGSDKQLTPEEDLAFRKKVVNDALTLSLKEIDDVKTKLNGFKFADKSVENSVRKQLIADLGKFEEYYRDLQGKIDRENDIEKIKEIAREAKTYREETYSPVISKALEFNLAFQTDKLVANADARYGKIEADIRKLEKADIVRPGYFFSQMADSKKLISDARSLADKAKNLVTDQESGNSEEKVITPTARELCEAALVNLKSGYGIFVDISTAVKKILKL